MRKTFFYLDQESTIISMLSIGGKPDSPSSRRGPQLLMVLLGSAAIVLALVYWQGGAAWQ